MAEKNKVQKVSTAKQENRFSKEQLLASERFRDRRDVLGTILADEKQYTINEAKELIEKYMKGKVK